MAGPPPTEVNSSSLGRKAVRGGTVSVAGKAAGTMLQVATLVILARLLTPADFGVLGMAATVLGLGALVTGMSLSPALVQKEELSRAEAGTAFYFMLITSVATAVVIIATAPLVADLYGEPAVGPVVIVSSLSMVLTAVGDLPRSLLQRELRFHSIAGVRLAAQAAGAVAAVLLALAGWGYWALVAQILVAGGCDAVLSWALCPWRPQFAFHVGPVRQLLTFGSHMTAFKIVNYFTRKSDDILVGWGSGARWLGLYGKAYALLLMPLQMLRAPLDSVALPVLSRIRFYPDQYREYTLRAADLIATVMMPFVVWSAVCADDLVLLLLGSQWKDAVPLYRVFAPASLVSAATATVGWVYVSLGRTRQQLVWSLFSLPVRITGFVVGLMWGAIGVAAGWTVTSFVLFLPMLYVCFHKTPVPLKAFLLRLAPPTASSVIAGAGLLAWDVTVLQGLDGAWRLLINGVLYGSLYAGLLMVLPRKQPLLTEIRTILGHLRS